jgi:hypothetical protein
MTFALNTSARKCSYRALNKALNERTVAALSASVVPEISKDWAVLTRQHSFEGVAHNWQRELSRCEMTRTSTSSGVSQMEVSSSPCGNGNSGVVGICYHLFSYFLSRV